MIILYCITWDFTWIPIFIVGSLAENILYSFVGDVTDLKKYPFMFGGSKYVSDGIL